MMFAGVCVLIVATFGLQFADSAVPKTGTYLPKVFDITEKQPNLNEPLSYKYLNIMSGETTLLVSVERQAASIAHHKVGFAFLYEIQYLLEKDTQFLYKILVFKPETRLTRSKAGIYIFSLLIISTSVINSHRALSVLVQAMPKLIRNGFAKQAPLLDVDFGIVFTSVDQDYIPIKYPGPVKEDTQNRYGSPDIVPEECRDKNFCTIKPPDYPQAEFNKMFKGMFPKSPPQPTVVIENVADRQGDPEEVDNCESTVTYEPLYKVRTKRGDWRTVVQAPEENYVQMVRLEICKETEGSCFTALPPTPDIKTFCKQKYSVWEFLVATENNSTEKIKADLPICCSCHYKFI